MSDMKAINAEAWDRSRDAPGSGLGKMERAFIFADIRDQLIKEGWKPEVDEAAALLDEIVNNAVRGRDLELIRDALAKARAHPADVVVAAKHVDDYVTDSHAMCLAAYILKDQP